MKSPDFPIGSKVTIGVKAPNSKKIRTYDFALYLLFSDALHLKISLFHLNNKTIHTFNITKIEQNKRNLRYYAMIPSSDQKDTRMLVFYPEIFLHSKDNMDVLLKTNAKQDQADHLNPNQSKSKDYLNYTEEQVINKIKKLFRLSGNNPSQEEAETAMMKAQELMAKHGLQMNKIGFETKQEVSKTYTGTRTTRIWWWEKQLANTIAPNFRCISVVQDFGSEKQLFFVGHHCDTVLAKEVYEYARHYILFAVKEYAQETQKNMREVKNQFLSGFVRGLQQKFEDQKKQHQEWGLVLAMSQDVQDYIQNELSLKYKHHKLPNVHLNHPAFQEGYQQGYRKDLRAPKGEIH